jgi:myo-inositol 2-dehydrogenase/D-chiro-inositol 1-dehydrogenase/scyllo-inositol 2-dehydrogenase (NAD+)
LGLLDGSCPADYGYDARVEVLGTEGVLLLGDIQEKALRICRKDRGIVTSQFSSWRDRFGDAYVEEIRHFTECIQERKDPRVTGEDGKRALEAVLAATKSMLTQEPVDLPVTDSGSDEFKP